MAADNNSLDLLEKTQAMIEVEQSLTAIIEKAEPWLLSNTNNPNMKVDPSRPRVRPIPETMDQVHSILAVARSFASRTSAPAEWNPNAPVVGFSTPNPLPHQLRGGALAALQLERARQAERDRIQQKKKRQRTEEEEEKFKSAAATAVDAKEKYPRGGPEQQRAAAERRAAREAHARRNPQQQQQQQQQPQQQPKQQQQQQLATMNLSDSSSDDDDASDSD